MVQNGAHPISTQSSPYFTHNPKILEFFSVSTNKRVEVSNLKRREYLLKKIEKEISTYTNKEKNNQRIYIQQLHIETKKK